MGCVITKGLLLYRLFQGPWEMTRGDGTRPNSVLKSSSTTQWMTTLAAKNIVYIHTHDTTHITQENHHPHSLGNRVGLSVMRAGIWAVLDYYKNNTAFYLCSALLLLSSWFSHILLWILLIRYVQSHLSCTDHYWHSFSHGPSMGLPKINLVSEAEMLGMQYSGHAMPLVTEEDKNQLLVLHDITVLKFFHDMLRMSHLMAPRALT